MLSKIPKAKNLIYLDYAATTPVDPRVLAAMRPYLKERYGNASSLYSLGQQAKVAIENSRAEVSSVLGCKSSEIVFTAGGTESVNLAIFGVVRNYLAANKNSSLIPHIITSKIEHHAVLESFSSLEKEGVKTSYIDVDKFGFINIEKLFAAIKPNTVLVSIMYANNEIGTVQPISRIAKQIRKLNVERSAQNLPAIIFHSDACQAPGFLDMNVAKLGVDLLSINSSKIYGPKQVGALFIRSGLILRPLIFGGGQERGLRSGTENVAGIVGFAQALKLAKAEQKKENKRLRGLRDYLIRYLIKKIPAALLNGPMIEQDTEANPVRLPNNINFSIPGTEGEALLLYLDSLNIAVSTGSACTTADADPSHVILATGRTKEQAAGTIRITIGKYTDKKQLDYVLKVLPELVSGLWATSPHIHSESYLKKHG